MCIVVADERSILTPLADPDPKGTTIISLVVSNNLGGKE